MTGYYFITDAALSRHGNIHDVKAAIAAGVEVVQYRAKEGSTRELCLEAARLRKLCRNSLFLINDRVDIALAVGADGVHLGQDDLPVPVARKLLGARRIIGVTTHTLAEAIQAERQGADYLGLSPIFSTVTKADAGKPAGLKLIERVRRAVKTPLIAIGGITLDNAPKVIGAGADGLCALSAVITSKNVKAEIQKFQRLFVNTT